MPFLINDQLLSSILWFRTGETVSLRSLAEMLANVMLT